MWQVLAVSLFAACSTPVVVDADRRPEAEQWLQQVTAIESHLSEVPTATGTFTRDPFGLDASEHLALESDDPGGGNTTYVAATDFADLHRGVAMTSPTVDEALNRVTAMIHAPPEMMAAATVLQWTSRIRYVVVLVPSPEVSSATSWRGAAALWDIQQQRWRGARDIEVATSNDGVVVEYANGHLEDLGRVLPEDVKRQVSALLNQTRGGQ